MNRTSKIGLIAGLTALGAATAYYFLIYRKSTTNANEATASIQKSISDSSVKLNEYEGKLLRGNDRPNVFLIKDGYKHWITSPEVLSKLGYRFDQVTVVPSSVTDSIPTGNSLSGLIPRNLLIH